MHRSILSITPLFCALCLVSSSVAYAQPPATQPTVETEKSGGYSFAVADDWEKVVGASKDGTKVFKLRRQHAAGHFGSVLLVKFGKPQKESTTIHVVAEGVRQGIRQSFPDLQFTDDQEAKLDGHEAWLLVFTGSRSNMQIKGYVVTAFFGGHTVQVFFMTDRDEFDTELTLAQKVIDSFKWLKDEQP